MGIEDALGGMNDPSAGYDTTAGYEMPPTKVEENKSKWRAFLDNFQDPNVRQAVLQTGIGLLKSPQYGQNSGDIISNALSSGVNTLQTLKNVDYARGQATQQRADTQKQRGIENARGDRQVAISERGATNAERQTNIMEVNTAQEGAQRGQQLGEQARHNVADEANDRIRAEAARQAAANGSVTGARVPAEIQKINALAAQYMQNGMDETNARARAVMVVDSTKGASSPGEAAMNLYQNKIKFFQNDISNFGKSPTPQQLQLWQNEAMNEVMQFGNFNTQQTGTPAIPNPNPNQPQNPRAGVIQRPQPAQGSSPVGAMKNGYKKVKAGPDSDKTTWMKANGNTK